jgi:hypothetical protein
MKIFRLLLLFVSLSGIGVLFSQKNDQSDRVFSGNEVNYIRGNKNLIHNTNKNYSGINMPSATIKFILSKAGYTTMKIYNIIGEEIAKLVDGYMESGEHNITFNTGNLPGGIYYYGLQSGSNPGIKRMILIK